MEVLHLINSTGRNRTWIVKGTEFRRECLNNLIRMTLWGRRMLIISWINMNFLHRQLVNIFPKLRHGFRSKARWNKKEIGDFGVQFWTILLLNRRNGQNQRKWKFLQYQNFTLNSNGKSSYYVWISNAVMHWKYGLEYVSPFLLKIEQLKWPIKISNDWASFCSMVRNCQYNMVSMPSKAGRVVPQPNAQLKLLMRAFTYG